ncbi:MAG: iron ABC transporter permease, partial [Blautia sp.]|nr:iron ABC transporter permease [Blautia sp.]
FALLGASLTALLVFGIASFVPGAGSRGINVGPIRLALSGAAVSTAASSLISTVMLPRTNVMQVFRFWHTGSIASGTWESIAMVLPFLLLGMGISLFLIPSLNVLALGDDIAMGLGVKVVRTRALGALSGVLLCGATTAVAGPIGFVGLMVPHLVRAICGGDMKILLPLSALDGAVLLLLSDVLGRYLGRPGELEVGIITAFLGAPVFIFIVKGAKVGR